MPPPPAPAPPSPFEWGNPDRIRQLLGEDFELKFERGVSYYREPSARSGMGHVLDRLRSDQGAGRQPGSATGARRCARISSRSTRVSHGARHLRAARVLADRGRPQVMSGLAGVCDLAVGAMEPSLPLPVYCQPLPPSMNERPVTIEGIYGHITSCSPRRKRGDRAAADAVFAALYDELHRMARRELARRGGGMTLGATTLLHDAYLNISRREGARSPIATATWDMRRG